ncbi:hypothetical protein TNCV_4571461 [Trichonephila clavipes]|nr:hypothetical protein TNCV_4571461 [Trichonephila clavipes]
MLTQSRPNASLILQVDATDYAIGGALNQNTALEPLAFYSRKLNAAKTKFIAYDRELLAVYAAIKHFSYTRALGDRPRNLEPWSSDEDDTCAGTRPLLTTTPAGGHLSSRQIQTPDIPATSLLP